MGIIQRFKDIMSANINALLDKAEDPEKMIDQTMKSSLLRSLMRSARLLLISLPERRVSKSLWMKLE